jgi:hypothetical protein
MRKLTILLVSASTIILHAASASAAVDLSIGGTAWYAWWKPAWSDGKASNRAYNKGLAFFLEDSHDFKPSSNAMAGPIISLGFLERWSIQTVFTMGRLLFKSNGTSSDMLIAPGFTNTAPSYKKYTRDVLKWDSDTSIGCAVHRMVKIFAGFKHQGYRYDETMKNTLFIPSDTNFFYRALTDDVRSYGGGLGVGLTIPVVADFYIMASVSGVALWSYETISVRQRDTLIYSISAGNVGILFLIPQKGHYFSYGGGASLSLAYNIEKINTTLSLGGRYQILFNRQGYNKYNPLFNDVSINIIDGQYDHFFGITLSAIYTFHIGKKSS